MTTRHFSNILLCLKTGVKWKDLSLFVGFHLWSFCLLVRAVPDGLNEMTLMVLEKQMMAPFPKHNAPTWQDLRVAGSSRVYSHLLFRTEEK